jgi:flagellar hook-basal body complex protein FliE
MIDGIKGTLAGIPSIRTLDQVQQAKEKPSSGGFSQALNDAMHEVSDLQTEADQKIEGLAKKQPGVTPHDAMIALEKADVAFQLMTTIKAKIIRAYEEVLRTQV